MPPGMSVAEALASVSTTRGHKTETSETTRATSRDASSRAATGRRSPPCQEVSDLMATPCSQIAIRGVGLGARPLSLRQRWRAGGRRWAASVERQRGHVARAYRSGEYVVHPAEALTRRSVADCGSRRVGCLAARDLPGARQARGRPLSRRRRLVCSVRIARVASPAGESRRAVDGRYWIAVLRARDARPAPFVVRRDDRHRRLELLDHHLRRTPRLV